MLSGKRRGRLPQKQLRFSIGKKRKPGDPKPFLPRQRKRDLHAVPLPDTGSPVRLNMLIIRNRKFQYPHVALLRHADFRGEVIRSFPNSVNVPRIGIKQDMHLIPLPENEIPFIRFPVPGNQNRMIHRNTKHGSDTGKYSRQLRILRSPRLRFQPDFRGQQSPFSRS